MKTPLLLLALMYLDSPGELFDWFIAAQATLETQYPHGKLSCETVSVNPGVQQSYKIHSMAWKADRTAWEYSESMQRLPLDAAAAPDEGDSPRTTLIREPDKLFLHLPGNSVTVATGRDARVRCPPFICVRPDEFWFHMSGPLTLSWRVYQSPERWQAGTHEARARREGDNVILERIHKVSGGGVRLTADTATGCVRSFEGWDDKKKIGGKYEWDFTNIKRPILKSCEINNGPSMSFSYKLLSIDLDTVPAAETFNPDTLKIAPGTRVSEFSAAGKKSYRFGLPEQREKRIPFDDLILKVRARGFASPARE